MKTMTLCYNAPGGTTKVFTNTRLLFSKAPNTRIMLHKDLSPIVTIYWKTDDWQILQALHESVSQSTDRVGVHRMKTAIIKLINRIKQGDQAEIYLCELEMNEILGHAVIQMVKNLD